MGIIKTLKLAYEYAMRDEDNNVVDVVRAVDGVDIDVERGTFLAILGMNGSGKSTLAKHINALLFPTEGTIWVEGKDTKDEENLLDVRQTAGMVFQNPDNQIIATVVEEDVGFGPENMGVPTEEIWRRVEKSLDEVGMAAYRKSSPDRLSGGQKQRVAIAGVMAMRPKCIVFDEPTAMLDPNGRKDVIRIAHELNQQEGITIILITHYMEETVDADRIIVMDHGKIIMDGLPREVFARVDELKNLRLDVPQVTELSYRLRKRGLPLPEVVLTMDEFEQAVAKVPHPFDASTVCPARTGGQSERDGQSGTGGHSKRGDDSGIGSHRERGGQSGTGGHSKRGDDSGIGSHNEKCGHSKAGRDAVEAREELQEKEEAVLEFRNVCFTYNPKTPMERHVLDKISFAVNKNDFIGVIGHTGSGKSTMILHMDGLLKASSGDVLFHGKSIYSEGFDMKTLRSKVVLVFQYPEHQLFEADVLSDVCFGPGNLGLDKEECESRAREALKLVGVAEDKYLRSPFELSGGQKRRVAIAGALAMHPEILVLDEPTAGLDPGGRDEILDTIEMLHKKQDMAVVLVSHSMEDVATYANRLMVVNDGVLLFDDTPKNVFLHADELEKIGLAAPQVTYINRKLIEAGWKLPAGLTTLDEAEEAIAAAAGIMGGMAGGAGTTEVDPAHAGAAKATEAAKTTGAAKATGAAKTTGAAKATGAAKTTGAADIDNMTVCGASAKRASDDEKA